MIADCCAEPIAGPPVDTRAIVHVRSALGPLGHTNWPMFLSLVPEHRASTLAEVRDTLAAIYLTVDTAGNLRWLGKVHRDGGMAARLVEHLAHPERARVYSGVYVLSADPFSPPKALAAAEGKAADLLGLRGKLGSRTWPSSYGWLRLVTSRYV